MPDARSRFAALLLCVLIGSACRSHTRAPDELVIMQTEAPRSMDPGNHTATYTTSVLDPMYEGLTRFDENLQIVPALATGWHANAAGTVWTARLRTGVKFHDGTPLTAGSAVASFRRLLNVHRGLAASSNLRAVVRDVAACGAMDICFYLKAPFAALPSLWTMTPVVSEQADRRGDLDRRAVGTGPYRFVEWKTGEYVLEERNPKYWGAPPVFARLRWLWSTEPALMNMALLAREVDLVSPLPPVFAEALTRNRRVQLIAGKSSAVFWVALNTKIRPLSDVRVRRALNYATDREALIRSQLRGYALPANSPLAPADFAYSAATRGYPFDLRKARQLLADAGLPNGFSLHIVAQEGQVNIMQALSGMWAQAGVTLHIQQMETGIFAETIFGDPAQKERANIGAVFASWTASSLDPEQQLGPLYRTSSWAPKGANLGFYSNPALDQLLDRARAELNPLERQSLYAQAQQLISDDAPHVLLYYATDLAAKRSRLAGPWIFPGGEVRVGP